MEKKVIIAVITNFFVLTISSVIDWVLDLGQFSGIVFFLYSYYGLIVVFIVYLLLGLIKEKYYFRLSLIPLAIGFALFFISKIIN